MKCSNCDNTVQNNSKFCTKCGNEIVSEEKIREEYNIAFIILIIVLIIFFISLFIVGKAYYDSSNCGDGQENIGCIGDDIWFVLTAIIFPIPILSVFAALLNFLGKRKNLKNYLKNNR